MCSVRERWLCRLYIKKIQWNGKYTKYLWIWAIFMDMWIWASMFMINGKNRM